MMDSMASRVAVVVGFITGLTEAVHLNDVVKTIILSALAAGTSYVVTKVFQWVFKKIFR